MKRTFLIALFAIACLSGQAKGKVTVWEHPSTEVNTLIDGTYSPLLQITRVEFAADETRLMMHIENGPRGWVKIDPKTHLVADGKEYGLKSLDGMELNKEITLNDTRYLDVVFHFDPLPKGTKRFDFTEGDFKGAWQLLGIENVATRASQLFPTNWRNTQTGDWEISFYEDFAIYDCHFWNYKQKQQNGDKYTFLLENDGKEITVNVEKNKGGQRNITINGQKAAYSLISTIALADYPQKDTRSTFRDTHYQTDTVTFIGWLKDMPEEDKKAGDRITITVYDNVFFDDNDGSKYVGKMDSLGRFMVKVPLLNSAEVFDWDHGIYPVFEPGETYFLLYDYKGGHKLFMGKDCRLQNEMLAYQQRWINAERENKMDDEAAMKFLNAVRASKQKAQEHLQDIIQKHPNVSDRYINYINGCYNAEEGYKLMQACFHVDNWKLPVDYTNYVKQEDWQHKLTPYTLIRDFSDFKRVYIDNLVRDSYYIATETKGCFYIAMLKLYSYILRKNKEAGTLQLTDEEMNLIDSVGQGKHPQDSVYIEIVSRKEVREILDKVKDMTQVYMNSSVLDSMECDEALHDIIITYKLYNILDHSREPLSDFAMQYFEENVKMPSAKSFLRAQQEKYMALQRGDLSHAKSLRSADDIANMSDGEKMMRKLLEPYKGKLVLLDIWGTWCGPCKEALSHSKEEYEELKDYDLVYMYLCNRSSEDSWKNVIKEYNVTGENVVHYNLPEDQQGAIEAFVGVSGYPTYKLFDREGNLLDLKVDARDLDDLKKLLDKLK